MVTVCYMQSGWRSLLSSTCEPFEPGGAPHSFVYERIYAHAVMKTQVAPSPVCLGRAQRWSCGLNMKPIRVVPIYEGFIYGERGLRQRGLAEDILMKILSEQKQPYLGHEGLWQ